MGTVCAPFVIKNILKASITSRTILLRPYSQAKHFNMSHLLSGNSVASCTATTLRNEQKTSAFSEISAVIQSEYPHQARRPFSAVASLESNAKESATQAAKKHRAFVAFGSNMGDRLGLIERACQALEREENITLKRTSGIWETKAMYYTDQNRFLNGVCEVGS